MSLIQISKLGLHKLEKQYEDICRKCGKERTRDEESKVSEYFAKGMCRPCYYKKLKKKRKKGLHGMHGDGI